MSIKKILVYLLIILLVIKSPIIVYAESAPGTISVSGGSIGSGGVDGNSNILKGTALTVVMATLASAGITVKLAAEDYAKGNTAINYLENKFAEWDSKTDDAWNEYEKYRALNETKVGSDGSLYIPEAASSIMQKFLNWLYANDQVNPIPQSGDATVNGALYDSLVTNGRGRYYISGNSNSNIVNPDEYIGLNVAWVQLISNGNYHLYAYSINDGSLFSVQTFIKVGTNWTRYASAVSNNYEAGYQFISVDYSSSMFESVPLIEGLTLREYLNGLAGKWEVNEGNATIQNTGMYGENINDIPQLVDESGNGKILIVQPGLIGQVQDAYTGSNNATIGIQDYLDSLNDLYGQQAIPQEITDLPDITIPGEDAITGTKEEVAVIDRDLVLAPDITVPADPGAITWPEVPDIAEAVADPSTPADPEITIPAMSVDLTKIFPFCIPWDLYNLLSKFNADPVTPSLTINWGNILGSIGVNFTTTLDLHDYDDVASILRTMETVLFVIGLAVATRNIFTQS